jgi:putative ABC transport system permease protein
MSGRHEALPPDQDGIGAGPRLLVRIRLRVSSGWRRLEGSASSAALAFAVLVCACLVLAVAGPRSGAQLRTKAFQQLAAATPAIDKTVSGTVSAGDLVEPTGQSVGLAQLQLIGARLRSNLARVAPLTAASSDWTGLTTPFVAFAGHSPEVAAGVAMQFELAYRSNLSRNARLVAGSLPAGQRAARHGQLIIQAAITAATAQRYGLRVGSRVPLPGNTGITLLVTGLVKPDIGSSPFWQADPIVARPVLVTPQFGSPYWQGGAFVPASALPVLDSRFDPANTQLSWMFGLRLRQLTASEAVALSPQLQPLALAAAGQFNLPSGVTGVAISLNSGAATMLASFSNSNVAVGNILDLLSVSLAVVGAGVVLLAAWLVAERRREEFASLRARGASRRQLGLASLRASAVCVLPAMAAGVAIALLLTPGQGAGLAWWLAGLVVATSLAGPALIAIRMHRGYAALSRPDQRPGRMTSVRRLVAESALVLGAVGGLITLRHQSTGAASGDIYASTAPVLVAIPVAIVLLRLYPLLVRPLLQIASRRSGVTAFLGLARAARVSAAALLPAFAMVLALSLVSFAGMVRGAVVRGEVAQSWQEAGADAVITVPNELSAAQQRAVAAVPGVQRTAAVGITTATRGLTLSGFTAVVADPAQYSALIAATPLTHAPASFAHWHASPASRAGAVPVLASAVLAAELGRAPVRLDLQDYQPIRVYVAGIAPAMSAVGLASSGPSAGYFVLPRSAVRGDVAPVNSMLVAGPDLDGSAIQKLMASWHVRGAGLILRSALLATLAQAPLQRGVYSELALGGDAAVAGCLLVLFLTLMLTAQSRQLTLTRAATMGMSATQARWLAVVEALPQILSVIIGGLICALALAPLVGPALQLSVFTGSTAAVPVRVEPAWLTGAAIALLVLAIATLTGQTVVAGRGTARSLRMDG